MDLRPTPVPPRRFETGSFALAPNFPAIGFRSHDEFAAWRADHQSRLDARYMYECGLATREPGLTQEGTCAPCLRPAVFQSETQPGEKLADGRRMPYWPRQMRCDCEDRLTGRQRAIIHLAQATGLAPWTNLLLFGTPSPADGRLARLVGSVTQVARLRAAPLARDPDRFVLDAPENAFHIALAQDYFEFVPPLNAALAGIAETLLPGGRLIFTTQFRFAERHSVLMPAETYGFAPVIPAEYREDSHVFGWDLLTMLRDAGFSDAVAYLTWSEELGYLGPMNFLFRATK
jgi:hypothetical protein